MSLVLITGASAGIGAAASRLFAERGDRVVGIARREEALAALERELGESFVPLPADVSDAGSMRRLADEVLERLGPPDVIVANAGVGLDALFIEATEELERRVFEVNVFGVVRTLRPFIPAMVERGSGRLLLISSVVGKRGIPHYAAYSASKFALHGLAEALRVELRDSGITVGLVCPSSTESEFNDRKLHRGAHQKPTRVQRHSAESVARAIVRMADSRRRELVLSAEGKLMAFLNKWAPGLLDRVLAGLFMRRRARAGRTPQPPASA